MGYLPYQLVQDFSHQQYLSGLVGLVYSSTHPVVFFAGRFKSWKVGNGFSLGFQTTEKDLQIFKKAPHSRKLSHGTWKSPKRKRKIDGQTTKKSSILYFPHEFSGTVLCKWQRKLELGGCWRAAKVDMACLCALTWPDVPTFQWNYFETWQTFGNRRRFADMSWLTWM